MKIFKQGSIYLIFNVVNDKVYIGQTKLSIQQRWLTHKKNSKNLNIKTSLYFAIRKFNLENFDIIELRICKTQKELDFFEKFFIKKFKSNNKKYGYNMNEGGNGNAKVHISVRQKMSNSLKGRRLTEKHKQAISEGLRNSKNRRTTDIQRQTIICRNQNKIWSLEERIKVSNGERGKIISKQQSINHSKCLIGRIWVNNGNRERFVDLELASKLLKCKWKKGRMEQPWKKKNGPLKCLKLWQKLKEPDKYFS